MRTQAIFVDRPSRVEIVAGLTSDQVDRLVIDVYTHSSLDPARAARSARTARYWSS